VKNDIRLQGCSSLVPERLRSLLGVVMATALVVVAPAAAVAAPEPGGIALSIEQFQEVVVKDKNGKESKKLEPLTTAAPGREVVFVMNYHNRGAKPADGVVLTNPVPKELLYVDGSQQGEGTQFSLSVDGGKTFGALEALKVAGADGSPRPATAADVTTLRWKVASVKAGAKGKVSYRAVLK